MLKIVVTGGRFYKNRSKVWFLLDILKPDLVIHGHCPRGADYFADEWCVERKVEFKRYPADWSKGRSAGPKRNQMMLDEHSDAIVLAFPGGSGTASTVSHAMLKRMTVLNVC